MRLIPEASTDGVLFERRWGDFYTLSVARGHSPEELLTNANLVILKPISAKDGVHGIQAGAAVVS